MIGWIVFAVVAAAVVVGFLLYIRRLRKWNSSDPTSADAKQAEARLWSTRFPQR